MIIINEFCLILHYIIYHIDIDMGIKCALHIRIYSIFATITIGGCSWIRFTHDNVDLLVLQQGAQLAVTTKLKKGVVVLGHSDAVLHLVESAAVALRYRCEPRIVVETGATISVSSGQYLPHLLILI